MAKLRAREPDWHIFCGQPISVLRSLALKEALAMDISPWQRPARPAAKCLGARQALQGLDRRGYWRDNTLVERPWRSVKYQEVYLKACDSVSAACKGIGRYLDFYNAVHPHPAHVGRTPDMVCHETLIPMPAAGLMRLVMRT